MGYTGLKIHPVDGSNVYYGNVVYIYPSSNATGILYCINNNSSIPHVEYKGHGILLTPSMNSMSNIDATKKEVETIQLNIQQTINNEAIGPIIYIRYNVYPSLTIKFDPPDGTILLNNNNN